MADLEPLYYIVNSYSNLNAAVPVTLALPEDIPT